LEWSHHPAQSAHAGAWLQDKVLSLDHMPWLQRLRRPRPRLAWASYHALRMREFCDAFLHQTGRWPSPHARRKALTDDDTPDHRRRHHT
jgi:hypothetical protein